MKKNFKGSKGIAEENRLKAFTLYKQGFSYRDIAKQVGVCHTRIHQYINGTLEELRNEQKALVEETRNLELTRLDDLLQICMPRALQCDYAAIDRVFKIIERRTRLLGLDKPNQIEHRGTLTLEELVLGSMARDSHLSPQNR